MPQEIRPTSLDHVALWTDQREPMASFCCDHLGMHVIEQTDTFTLIGVDAKDATNTLAVFLRGPAGVRIEYVEHKPGFALV